MEVTQQQSLEVELASLPKHGTSQKQHFDSLGSHERKPRLCSRFNVDCSHKNCCNQWWAST